MEADAAQVATAPREAAAVVPEKLVVEVRLVTDANTPPLKLQLPSEKILIQLSQDPQTGWQKAREALKDLGPALTGIATTVIAALAFSFGSSVNERQTKVQEMQATNQEMQRLAAQAELRAKVLAELNDRDETKRTLAAIRLAGHGEDALDALKMALGVEQETIREGATTVVFQMFRSETVPRPKLFGAMLGHLARGTPFCVWVCLNAS